MSQHIKNNIESYLLDDRLQSIKKIYQINKKNSLTRWLNGILLVMVACLFLPWTQNIKGKGTVTTLYQKDRPQEVNSIIAGRVTKWFVKEGDFVQKGDTLLMLSEVKVDYLDTALLSRTNEQIVAKDDAIINYRKKASTSDSQIKALNNLMTLKMASISNKINQQTLKIKSDSADLVANTIEQKIYRRQIDAAKLMLDKGVISQTEFEKRTSNFQNNNAKQANIENKILQARQEILNLEIEKNTLLQDFLEKTSKIEGERFSSLSNASSTVSEVAKLKNLYANYDARNKFYFILAPQQGQIGNLMKSGIGEIIKEGDFMAEIIPTQSIKAVEMFIDPVDLPLISNGQEIMFVFDGFPAIMFSGWPRQSYGTFRGKVNSIESAISQNGKFRLLITEDLSYRPWPQYLRIGSGAQGIALLKNVRLFYELWRNLNGFPPEYYAKDPSHSLDPKKQK